MGALVVSAILSCLPCSLPHIQAKARTSAEQSGAAAPQQRSGHTLASDHKTAV